MTVNGTCAPEYAAVREEFERNFAERDELGASVCVIVDGEPVVDLWGGIADEASQRSWDRDTINVICSCTKGAAALCGNMLIDRGELDPDRPVVDYWPEFGKHGKDAIPVRQVFNHQSGVAHWGPQLPDGGVCDWELVIHALEDTEPFWTPGTRQGYHGFTIGYLVGELVRRITGRSIGTFFADEVAGPLGLDFWIGLPSEYESRVATTVPFDLTTATTLPPDFLAQMANPDSIAAKFFVNGGGWLTNIDRRDMHAAELPAAGGITNGRGLAGMYAVLATGGVPLVSAGAVSRMRVAQSVSDWDAVIGARTSYTMGFSKSWPNRDLGVGKSVIIGEDAFGTPGLGGQMGFADPAYRLAFGYTMNRHGIGTGLNERGQSLIDATYRILGSPTSEPGYWVRVR